MGGRFSTLGRSWIINEGRLSTFAGGRNFHVTVGEKANPAEERRGRAMGGGSFRIFRGHSVSWPRKSFVGPWAAKAVGTVSSSNSCSDGRRTTALVSGFVDWPESGISPCLPHAAGASMERHGAMIDLAKFYLNPFDDAKISLNHLIDYSSTHLQRMVTNNPGALLNARITGTTTALTGLDNTMQDNEAKLALRMARVQAKDAFRGALPENLSRIHGAVVAAFGPDSTQLTECFPQGRTPFLLCPDDQLDDKLQALNACLTPYAAQVGQVHLDNLGGLLSTWIALLASVETASALKNSSESARRNARATLQLELFKNLLALATAFPNDVAKATLYCPQNLLENPVAPPAAIEAAA